MPTICVFYGITVRMYYDDHSPPHFHVFYGDFAAKISIDAGDVIAGTLPGRVLAITREWSEINRAGRIENWRRCQLHESLLDPVLFQQVAVDQFGAICWPNDADLSPDTLYADLALA